MLPDLIAAKAEIMSLPLIKDATGDKAKYIKLTTLLAAVEPILLAHGILIVQGQGDEIGADGVLYGLSVQTTLLHRSGEWLATSVPIPVSGARIAKKDGGGNHPVNAQDGGISLSYGRRYGIFAILSISVDEDTDGAHKTLARRRRAREVAEESMVEQTQARTEALKNRVGKLVTAPEGCPTCKAPRGTSHKKGCTDG